MREIIIAHTPDADDAFMFYALTAGIIKPTAVSITHKLMQMQILNEAAIKGEYEMSALSFAAYPQVADRYFLMSCGACMGYKTGPMLLAKEAIEPDKIKQLKIAVPGKLTTAYLLLKIFCPEIETVPMPFNLIMDAVLNGSVEAGLVIDGGQMTYSKLGLTKILDLGIWWYDQTSLPLPLGGNIVRRDLPETIITQLVLLLKQSVRYALEHREEAVEYAMRYSQGMSKEQAMQFIGRYVNELTLDYGDEGKAALNELFKRGHAAGLIQKQLSLEFV